MMARTIAWERTGGRTHRVTITEERVLTEDEIQMRAALNWSLAGYYDSRNGVNIYRSPEWESIQAQKAANALHHGALCWDVPRAGVFGGMI